MVHEWGGCPGRRQSANSSRPELEDCRGGGFRQGQSTDILWRNTSTGENYIWYLDGVAVVAGAHLPGVVDQSWKIAVVADFNNDGNADILWRNTLTGENYIWYLDGVMVLGGGSMPTVADQNWTIAEGGYTSDMVLLHIRAIPPLAPQTIGPGLAHGTPAIVGDAQLTYKIDNGAWLTVALPATGADLWTPPGSRLALQVHHPQYYGRDSNGNRTGITVASLATDVNTILGFEDANQNLEFTVNAAKGSTMGVHVEQMRDIVQCNLPVARVLGSSVDLGYSHEGALRTVHRCIGQTCRLQESS